MRVGIIGAGLAGLAAARTLQSNGHEPVVFEKEAVAGGRLQTARIGEYTFDPGATTLAPMGKSIEKVILSEISTEHLVRIAKPVAAHDGVRAFSGALTAANTPRYCYSNGIDELPKLLAAGVSVRTSAEVHSVEAKKDGSYTIDDEFFDAVVVTAPIPECIPLLTSIGESRRFANTKFRSCISVMLGFEATFEASYHALVGPDQTHPLSWLCIESLKCPGTRAPEGCTAAVAQMSAEYSRRRFESDDDLVIEETLGDVIRLLGRAFATPAIVQVKRFKHSHPEATTSFEAVNSPLSRLVVAGDALMGGRTELAYETGLRAAKMIMENS